ncbi:MAG: hypothetical protein FWC70_11280 [Defluviitaleaceae bacterium]|nr:hypothetical protein [Defluviitaleaceae bacterium]
MYDLQDDLKKIKPGPLLKTPLLFPSSRHHTPDILKIQNIKTIFVSGKVSQKPGITLVTPRIKSLRAGDKIVVTGRIGNGAPTSDWAMVIDRRTKKYGYVGLAQTVSPNHNELFSIEYLLEPEDLRLPIMVRTNLWGTSIGEAEYFVDSILITRNVNAEAVEIETRELVYSLANDNSLENLKPGDIHKFIKASGTPLFDVFDLNEKKAIRVRRRMNNWDGLDVWFPDMNLKQGNRYTITVRGKIDGVVPPGTHFMLQIIPGYIWQSVTVPTDNREFTLTHTFSAMELKTLHSVRIATDDAGAEMCFTIREIEVTSSSRE